MAVEAFVIGMNRSGHDDREQRGEVDPDEDFQSWLLTSAPPSTTPLERDFPWRREGE